MLGGTRAPEQLRAPPRGLLPAAAAPRLLPRCAAPGAGAESPPQLQGRPGWVTPPPPAPLPDPAGRMEPPEGAGPGGECGPKCPGVPELRLFPQPDAAPFPPAHSSAAPGGRARPPGGSELSLAGAGGSLAWRWGKPGPGQLPGTAPALGGGRTHRVPAPLSSALSVLTAARRAPGWLAQSFVLNPKPAEPGFRGSGHGACLGRSLGSSSARRGGRRCPPGPRICFVRPSRYSPGARSGRPPLGSCRAPRWDRAWGKGGVAPGLACRGGLPHACRGCRPGRGPGALTSGRAGVHGERHSRSPCPLSVTLTSEILPRSPLFGVWLRQGGSW